eukprot:m.1053119 g.1053119  ORF g.1053119 m.1053119 type:complete len:94 (+) comp24185_c0_seq62:130-411(+)
MSGMSLKRAMATPMATKNKTENTCKSWCSEADKIAEDDLHIKSLTGEFWSRCTTTMRRRFHSKDTWHNPAPYTTISLSSTSGGNTSGCLRTNA